MILNIKRKSRVSIQRMREGRFRISYQMEMSAKPVISWYETNTVFSDHTQLNENSRSTMMEKVCTQSNYSS